MLIETGIAILIIIAVFLLGLIGVIGWITEGERLSQEREENRRLQHRIRKLEQRLAHMHAAENIRVANEYYEESMKND